MCNAYGTRTLKAKRSKDEGNKPERRRPDDEDEGIVPGKAIEAAKPDQLSIEHQELSHAKDWQRRATQLKAESAERDVT